MSFAPEDVFAAIKKIIPDARMRYEVDPVRQAIADSWPDNMDESKWFYLHVQEATNSHDCEHRADGSEYWTVLTEVPDWERYER